MTSRRRFTILAAGAALLLAVSILHPADPTAAMGARAAARVPDLTVRSLSTKPVTLTQRGTFRATVTIRNTGRQQARGARLIFVLSTDRRRSAGDVVLGSRSRIAPLAPGRRVRMTKRLVVPDSVAGPRFLIACATRARRERDTADNCKAVARTVKPRSTGENPNADPIEVEPVLEPAHAVTRTIGVEGGSLRTTGADGTAYELVVPPDALASAVEITMTPIAGLGESPYSGRVDGVELTPDGLHLANPAMLRITPTELVPAVERSPFAYRSDGLDFVLALFKVVGGSYEMPVLHFTGDGVAQGTPIQRTSVANSEPYSFQWKHDNDVASAVLNGTADIEDLFDRHYDAHLRPALVWATTAQLTEMHRVQAAVVEYLSHARQVQMLRENIRPGTQQRIDAGWELVRQATNNMVRKAWSACLNDHQPEHVLTALALERQAALMGLDTGSGNVFDPGGYVPRCLRFELDVRGTYVLNPPTGTAGYYRFHGVGYEGTIPLEVGGAPGSDPSTMVLGGEADLVSFEQTFTEECRRSPCTPCGGSGAGAVFDTPATVLSFDPDLSVVLGRGPDGRPAKDPRPTKITLNYLPGTSTEQWIGCGYGYPMDVYESVFSTIHTAERRSGPAGASYLIEDWEFVGGEHWAHKEYDDFVCGNDDPLYGGCYRGYRETSTLDVVHAPRA